MNKYYNNSDDPNGVKRSPGSQCPQYEPTIERNMYKVLCTSALPFEISDEIIKEALYREYWVFGDFIPILSYNLNEHIAFICFRTHENARKARHYKPRIIVYNKIVDVKPVYEALDSEYEQQSEFEMSDRHYNARSVLLRPPPALPIVSMGQLDFHPVLCQEPMKHVLPRFRVFEEKLLNNYTNFLEHIQPQDDPLATRTLFVGNLDVNIPEIILWLTFVKYGIVEDINFKTPLFGNAFAFIRYLNLDMAYRAKVNLSGQYIGKYKCKIGYAKIKPTMCIWIGGLGIQTSVMQLVEEFSRFGFINDIKYQNGSSCAYIQYESIDAAITAVNRMRGFPLGESRIKLDYADLLRTNNTSVYKYRNSEAFVTCSFYKCCEECRRTGLYQESCYIDRYRIPPSASSKKRKIYRLYESEHHERKKIRSRSRSRSSLKKNANSNSQKIKALSTAKSLSEVTDICTTIWQGELILKNILLPVKLHLINGDPNIIGIIKDINGKNQLHIKQRLRLDLLKLNDAQKRSISSGTIFLCSTSLTDSQSAIKINVRRIDFLKSYLKYKNSAGVIRLLNEEKNEIGLVYIFSGCKFSLELLKNTCHNLSDIELMTKNYLIIFVVRKNTE